MSTLSNDLRRLEERRRVAELEAVYGNVLGLRDGYRTMPTVRRVARMQAQYNRGNPAVLESEGGGKRRGRGVTKKRLRRGKR